MANYFRMHEEEACERAISCMTHIRELQGCFEKADEEAKAFERINNDFSVSFLSSLEENKKNAINSLQKIALSYIEFAELQPRMIHVSFETLDGRRACGDHIAPSKIDIICSKCGMAHDFKYLAENVELTCGRCGEELFDNNKRCRCSFMLVKRWPNEPVPPGVVIKNNKVVYIECCPDV